MKMPMFRNYDLIIVCGVFFLTLLGLATFGDRQIGHRAMLLTARTAHQKLSWLMQEYEAN